MSNKTKKLILDKITQENIEPISKSHFDWKNRIIWVMVGVGITFLIAISSFLLEDVIELFSFGPSLIHPLPFLFFVPHLIWLVLLLVITFFVYKEFRGTKKGYKYETKYLLFVLIIIAILGTTFSFYSGIGSKVHNTINRGEFGPSIYYNEKVWDDIEEGRLIGIIEIIYPKSEAIKSGKILLINTKNDGEIEIYKTNDLFISPQVQLVKGERIRLFGKNTNTGFEVYRIMPWLSDRMMRGGMMMDDNNQLPGSGIRGGDRMMRDLYIEE